MEQPDANTNPNMKTLLTNKFRCFFKGAPEVTGSNFIRKYRNQQLKFTGHARKKSLSAQIVEGSEVVIEIRKIVPHAQPDIIGNFTV